jgi:hypothetical protein
MSLSTARPSISLLHATFHAPDPVGVRDVWLARARHRDRVEHIFALDADDAGSVAATEGCERVVSPADNGGVTSVRNWNAAAARATGDLLFVIADDLLPPVGWDVALGEAIGHLDPRRVPFAIKIGDGGARRDTLLRHPVISRAFYSHLGLFSSAFRGVFCDNDLSIRAFRSAVIIDARRLKFTHGGPDGDPAAVTYSKRELNRPKEYEDGLSALRAAWTRRQRETPRVLLRVGPGQRLSPRRLRAITELFRVYSTVLYAIKLARARVVGSRLLTDD